MEGMHPRQREIFEQLTAGINLDRGNFSKKRIPAAEAHSQEQPKKRKQKISNPPNTKGVDLFKADSEAPKKSVNVKNKSVQNVRSLELERAASIRKRHSIKVSAPHAAPCPVQSFMELQERVSELNGLVDYAQSNGFASLTPIQMQAIPALLDGRDLIGIAPTGSGKTLAFLLPILAQLRRGERSEDIQVFVISPTCELSSQTYHTFVNLQQAVSMDKPVRMFLLDKSSTKKLKNRKPEILFATPFALVKQIQKGNIDASHVQFLVLDEADRLFSTERRSKDTDVSSLRHYVSQLDAIAAACTNKDLVKALFSATFPPNVSDLAQNILINPVCITIGKKNAAVPSVEQHLMYTGSERGKLLAVRQIFAQGISPPVVIFVDTKERAKALLSELRSDGINVAGIHSEMEARQRNRILQRFQNGLIWVLIATDLVSRGIDFVDVHMVINYDFPKSTMDYIHRIGRTGRAGKQGKSYTFFTDGDRGYIRPIANTVRDAGGDVPEWMTSLKKDNWKDKRSYGAIGQDKS